MIVRDAPVDGDRRVDLPIDNSIAVRDFPRTIELEEAMISLVARRSFYSRPKVSMIRLFDEFTRIDRGYSLNAEPQFSFLNRTALSRFSAARALLEMWFLNYPDDERRDFVSRFRSEDDDQHHSAFFELFLHELFLKLGFSIDIHPRLPETTKTPDFLVKTPCGESFYLEAKVATGQDKERRKSDARINTFHDTLNEIESPDFYLSVHFENPDPTHPLPGRRIRSQIEKWLSGLNYDQIMTDTTPGDYSRYPEKRFEDKGYAFSVKAIPQGSLRGNLGRPIASRGGRCSWIGPVSEPILDAAKSKAGRYGKPDRPYVIAVHDQDSHMGPQDLELTLFGVPLKSPVTDLDDRARTKGTHGFWTGGSGPAHTRVSGLLIVRELYPSAHCIRRSFAFITIPGRQSQSHCQRAESNRQQWKLPAYNIGQASQRNRSSDYPRGGPAWMSSAVEIRCQ